MFAPGLSLPAHTHTHNQDTTFLHCQKQRLCMTMKHIYKSVLDYCSCTHMYIVITYMYTCIYMYVLCNNVQVHCNHLYTCTCTMYTYILHVHACTCTLVEPVYFSLAVGVSWTAGTLSPDNCVMHYHTHVVSGEIRTLHKNYNVYRMCMYLIRSV